MDLGIANSTRKEDRVSYVYLLVEVPSPQSCIWADLPPQTQITEPEFDLDFTTQPPTYRKQENAVNKNHLEKLYSTNDPIPSKKYWERAEIYREKWV